MEECIPIVILHQIASNIAFAFFLPNALLPCEQLTLGLLKNLHHELRTQMKLFLVSMSCSILFPFNSEDLDNSSTKKTSTIF